MSEPIIIIIIKDKYLDVASELKMLWNMKVMIVPIVIGAYGTITKGLLKGLEDAKYKRKQRILTKGKT